MSEYSIADFLATLSDEKLEKLMIKLIFEGYAREELLEKLLEKCEAKK
jgi:hypothetical protein